MKSALLLIAAGMLASAQTPKLAFEVVSIKPTKETLLSLMQAGKPVFKQDRAQLAFYSISLPDLIRQAYGLSGEGLDGAARLPQDLFEIHAKLPEGASEKQIPEMLQSMLEERFGLKVHHED